MSQGPHRDAHRPAPDSVIVDIANYVHGYGDYSPEARNTARHCLTDSMGCAIQALQFPACRKLLGPVVPGAEFQQGARVPGTPWQLEPVQAAFNIGTMIRWLDFNDTWLAAEWGHPSDNLGGILALADYLDRRASGTENRLTIGNVLSAMIKAHEIQGIIALENAFNRVGLDHVLLVRVATTAVAASMLDCNLSQIINAVSHAWIDGSALRTYRHAPNTGSRKSWAAGDATSRGVRLALIASSGEMGYPSALSAPQWGFQDVQFEGKPLIVNRPYASYVMENVLFKVSFPAEFHAQTAIEAAVQLHPEVVNRLADIARIVIETQESAIRIIDKTGPLDNPADRDHCLQYMTAVGLLKGDLEANDYEDDVAADPRIDRLRGLMEVKENAAYTRDYLDRDRQSIGNAVQVFFSDGSATENVAIEYPIGHRRRREEGIPLLEEKFRINLERHYPEDQVATILAACSDQERLEQTRVSDFVGLLVSPTLPGQTS